MSATVANDGASAGVTWSISPSDGSCGSVASSGATAATYTAPATVTGSCTATVVAKSVTDPAQSSSTQITAVVDGTDYSNTGLLYGSYTCYFQGHKNDGTAEAMVWTMKANCIIPRFHRLQLY